MIGSCVYVSNQAITQYPIHLVVDSLRDMADHVFVFGDQLSLPHLDHLRGPDVEIIEHPVVVAHPNDIAYAQNYCRDLLFNREDLDLLLLSQADDVLYPSHRVAAVGLVDKYDWCHWQLPRRNIRLYMMSDVDAYGLSFIRRSCQHRYVGDGAYLKPCIGNENEVVFTMGCGYLSAAIYQRKLQTWQGLFPGKEKDEFLALAQNDLQAAVEHELRRLKLGNEVTLPPKQGPDWYEWACTQLGDVQERQWITSLLKNLIDEDP